MYFEQFIDGLNMAADTMEKALSEVYEQSKTATGRKKAEINWMIKILENGESYDFGDLVIYFRYLNTPCERVEGKLRLADNDRFQLDEADTEFTSGDRIEVFIDDPEQEDWDYGWNFGRVEFSHKEDFHGYYLYNYSGHENYLLKPGMLAAVRKKIIK